MSGLNVVNGGLDTKHTNSDDAMTLKLTPHHKIPCGNHIVKIEDENTMPMLLK
jgi:hypothetical protein